MAPKRKAATAAPPPAAVATRRGGKKSKVDAADTEEGVDYELMKVADLKKACEAEGLDSKGKKADLLKRLQDGSVEPDKKEHMDANEQMKKAMEAIKSEGPKERKNVKVDDKCPLKVNAQVYKDYDCMLNQTNIGHNNNKFYVIQLLCNEAQTLFWTWNRWGRVGEPGQTALKSFSKDCDKAIADFEKKFKDKTKNNWENRHNFLPSPGKYTLLEMDDDADDEEEEEKKPAKTGGSGRTKPCTLDPAVKELIELIFDDAMFANTMMSLNLDIKKMPLGKISKQQIAKGFDALVELEDAIKANKGYKEYERLTSKFYTLVPHDFKRTRPEVIASLEKVQEKKDMLIVLTDIEIAQGIKREQEQKSESEPQEDLPPHPLEVKYEVLGCDLRRMDRNEEMYKIIEDYKKLTNPTMKLPILNIYEITRLWKKPDGHFRRKPEVTRFKACDKLGNRKLLWHGTKIAVVAAILQGGLRIMPHSGGRVGRGLYFASENGKSACYVGPSGGWGFHWKAGSAKNSKMKNVGIMFLAEVALGKEHGITVDNCSLVKPPLGYDSVVARGQTEPDPKKYVTKKFDGREVVIPSGPPVKTEYEQNSSFAQSEYLVYNEAQVRLRYMLELDYNVL